MQQFDLDKFRIEQPSIVGLQPRPMDIEYDKAFTKHFLNDPLFEEYVQSRRPVVTANITYAELLPGDEETDPTKLQPPGYLTDLYPVSVANLGGVLGTSQQLGAPAAPVDGARTGPPSPEDGAASAAQKWSRKTQPPQHSPFRALALKVPPGPEGEAHRSELFFRFDLKKRGLLYLNMEERENPVRMLFRECQLSSSYLLARVKCDLKVFTYLSLLILQFATISQWNAETENLLRKRVERLLSERAYLQQPTALNPWTAALAQVYYCGSLEGRVFFPLVNILSAISTPRCRSPRLDGQK